MSILDINFSQYPVESGDMWGSYSLSSDLWNDLKPYYPVTKQQIVKGLLEDYWNLICNYMDEDEICYEDLRQYAEDLRKLLED